MNLKDLRTTNMLLVVIIIPIVFYFLKILGFIFVPLVLAMFIALLFLPLMRWLRKKNVPQPVSIVIVIVILLAVFRLSAALIQLATHEIVSMDTGFLERAEVKLLGLVVLIEEFLGLSRLQDESVLAHYFENNNILGKVGPTLDFIGSTVSMILITSFFVVLLLADSLNIEKLLNSTLFKVKYASIKNFRIIEKDIIKFVLVKFFVSALTGIGFSVACLFFDISFPIFWGLFAFSINFVQVIGSIISVLLLSLFAFIEMDPSGTLLLFILIISAVQIVMGGVLEPVFMGKTFSINIITILIMLMFWGYIWGVPGLIMAIPITVFIKVNLNQFPRYKIVSDLMSGKDSRIKVNWKKTPEL